MFRITAVIAKTIFSTWYSFYQIVSFMGHIVILIKDPALDSVIRSMAKFSLMSFSCSRTEAYSSGPSFVNLVYESKF